MAKKIGGVVGIWSDEHELIRAAHKVRESGFVKFDAITPYPVHGIEEAVGIRRSMIPWVTFFAGSVGLACGLGLQIFTSAYDWAVNVGGKPFVSGPAFIPVTFEVTILFAALASVVALFVFCRLPKVDPPIIDPDLTSHKFALFVPENDVNYDAAKVEQMLKTLGADNVHVISEF